MDDLVYKWKEGPEPVQFVKDIFLPGGFSQGGFSQGYCNVRTATGNFSWI